MPPSSSAIRRAAPAATPLSAGALRCFERDGFVVVPQFYGSDEVSEIAGWTEALAAAPEAPGSHWVYREDSLVPNGGKVLQRIENFYHFHAGFRRLMSEGRLVAAIGQLLGDAPVLFKDKINFKMPGGAGFKPHQDQQAGWGAYAPYFVTALVSIDATTAENGCLEFAPGRHKEGLIGAEWRPLEESELPRASYEKVPTGPGDVVFFDSFAPHASEPNRTALPRRVLYITYNAAAAGDQRERYYADKHRNFPPDIERVPGRSYVFRV
jgi:ectoine hydroxylase-related dioxygenase (phytanoyl-CoA dioxygenase family)